MNKNIAAAIIALVLAACSAGAGNAPGMAESAAETSAVTQAQISTDTAPYTQVSGDEELARSLYSTGNTERIQKAMVKAQNGEKCTLAYIGGSITEGVGAAKDTCYAYLSYKRFADRYGTGDNVEYVNAGMSGTPSNLGMLRAQRDILDKQPDVVFVEFAVNDSTDTMAQNCYESLLRTLLNGESAPAVILVINRTDNGYNAGEHMKKLGEYYSLPVVSVTDAITPLIDEGKMSWSDYSNDGAHPNINGHERIAEMIDNYYAAAEKTPSEGYTVPAEALIGAPYENARLITPVYGQEGCAETEDTGSFVPSSKGCSGFPESWDWDGGDKPLKAHGKFTALFVIYKRNKTDNMGAFEVYLNGERAGKFKTKQADGWGEAYSEQVIKFHEPHDMDIEIRPSADSEGKSIDILGIAIVE